MDVQDALQVGLGDQFWQGVLARRLELAAILAQFRRNELHAKDVVEVGLVLAGDLLLALPDAILADLDVLALRVGAQRDVVRLGAGGMVQKVGIFLVEDEAQIQRDA